MSNLILDPKNITEKTEEQFLRNEWKDIGKVKKGIVYLITNILNNKKYVGITTLTLNRRWWFHKRDSKVKNYPLYMSMRKHGLDNFIITPLLFVYNTNKKRLIEELNGLEIKYVKYFNSFIDNDGYNLTIGGGVKNISSQSRRKQSLSMKTMYKSRPGFSKELGERIKKAYKNNPLLRIQVAEKQKSRYNSDDERKRMGKLISQAYENNPKLRDKLSKIHLDLNKRRPDLGKNHSKRISGHNHPRFNCTIYKFLNTITGDIFTGTSYDFRMKYNLSQSKMSLLVNGKRNNHKNWRMI